MSNHKVVIIGSGYQGLIAAGLLAKAGVSVQVVETQINNDYAEFLRGYRTGPCTHLPVTLPYAVVDALSLESHGLDVTTLKPQIFAPHSNDEGGFTVTDNPFVNLPFFDSLAYLETALQQLEYSRPPYKEKAWRDTWGTFELGRLLANSSAETQKIFADSAAMSLQGLLDRVDMPQLEKSIIESLAVLGSRTDPVVKGSACAIISAFAAFNATRESYTLTGSLHEVIKALKQSAMTFGVQFVEGQVLSSVTVKDGAIESVTLDGGETITANYFVTDCDPVNFFDSYIDASVVPPAFKTRLSKDQFLKETVHLKMAVTQLPRFRCLHARTDVEDMLSGQIIIAPDPSYIADARADMKKDGGSQLPVISMVIPSLKSRSLAPDGTHSLSIMAQYFSADLPDDKETNDAIILACIQAIDAYAPGFADTIKHCVMTRGMKFVESCSQFGQPHFSGSMPLLQLFKIYFGHHALGYDLPLSNLVMAGYGSEATTKPHILQGGQMAANLLQSILKSDKD